MEEEEKIPKKNYTVFFNIRLSVAEKLVTLNMQKEEAFTLNLIIMKVQYLQ